MPEYLVTATLKNPGVYHSGFEINITAANRKEAISIARRIAKRECAFDRHDGPKKWDAERI